MSENKTITIEGRNYSVSRYPEAYSDIHFWSAEENDRLDPAFVESFLGFIRSKEAASRPQPALILPGSGKDNWANNGLHPEFGFGIHGQPGFHIGYSTTHPVTLLSVIQDTFTVLEKMDINPEKLCALYFEMKDVEYEASTIRADKERGKPKSGEVAALRGMGFGFVKPEHLSLENVCERKLAQWVSAFPFGGPVYFCGFIDLPGEHPCVIEPETLLTSIEIDVFVPGSFIAGY